MERIPTEAVANFLAQTTLFRGCPAPVLTKLGPAVEQKDVPWGHVLLQAGEPVTGVGVIFAGRASVRFVQPSGETILLEEVGAGDSFGEWGLIVGGPSTLSLMAEEDCRVLFLRKEYFDHVLGAVPVVTQTVARIAATRYLEGLGKGRSPAPAPSASSPGTPAPEPAAAPMLAGTSVDPRRNEIRFVETVTFNLGPQVLDLVPRRLVLQHRVLPLELKDRKLLIGMVNPTASETRQELRRVLHNVDPEFAAISIDDFNQAVLRNKLDMPDKAQSGPGAAAAAARIVYATEHRKEVEKQGAAMGEETVRLLDRILIEAHDRGASDIHIEPEASTVRVRYRVQGFMIERADPIGLTYANGLVARIKVLADLDITEKRIPQDGRIACTIGNRELNFRVSTLATGRGEKIVMRILDPVDVMRPLEHIFVDTGLVDLVSRAVSVPHGAIFVAGPTGSGKSSTLYSLLNRRKTSRPDNNIVTVEDPVEFNFPGITQTPLNPKIGLDYPTVLRAMMRQDPDVIMIGELRDATSSGIAIEAALTGHLVLTSIHGSNSVAVLQRLAQFDIPPLLLSQALNLIVVQRLAPKLCAHCVKEEEVSPAMLQNLQLLHLVDKNVQSARLPRPVGCAACDKTGRKGRVAVVEILSLQDDMRTMLGFGAAPVDLLKHAAEVNQFLSFRKYAQQLMARKLLAPADAVLVVTD